MVKRSSRSNVRMCMKNGRCCTWLVLSLLGLLILQLKNIMECNAFHRLSLGMGKKLLSGGKSSVAGSRE